MTAATGTSAQATVVAGRVERFVDGCLDVAVAAVALWTVLYWAVLAGLPLMPLLAAWAVGVAGLVWWYVRSPWTHWLPAARTTSTWVVVAVGLGLALLASMVARPDGDDASFVARSTWVADHGSLPRGDFVFGEPGWPATFGSDPNVSSVEALFGALARVTGLPTGDVVYRYVVPLATFAAVWVLWVLLRTWRARRPVASLLLALLFLVLGGYAHATWGNLHLARIWQGKVLMLAVLVPYLYACVAAVWQRPSVRATRADLVRLGALLAIGGLAAVGCSSTAVFLVPLVAGVTSLGLLVARRWREAVVVVLAASIGPLVAGVMTVLSPVGARNEGGRSQGWLWLRVLGDAPTIWVLVAAATLVVVAGVLWPRWCAAVDRPSQVGLAWALVAGFLCTVPPVYPVLTALTGGDAIAYRLAWVLPVPAVVGLVASLPGRRWGVPVVPATVAATVAILVVAQPLWSAANAAAVARPGTWKVRDQADLAAARWIVEQDPQGRYLAANWVAIMTGVLTSELRPVGTRMDYVSSLEQIPDSAWQERELLQSIADGVGARTPENLDPARAALDDLDVEVACVAWDDAYTQELFDGAGFTTRYAVGPWTCRDRPPGD